MLSDTRSTRRFLIALSALLFAAQMAILAVEIPRAVRGPSEFRRFYEAGGRVRSGHLREMYGASAQSDSEAGSAAAEHAGPRFDRPAYEALLFVPFAMLGYPAAYACFLVFNLALLGLGIRLMDPYLLRIENVVRWMPAAVFLCFGPVALALAAGADSIVLLTLVIAAAVLYYRDRDVSAGVCLGLTVFNPLFVGTIAVLMMFWRRWRLAAACGVAAAGCLLVSRWMTGAGALGAWARGAILWSVAPSSWAAGGPNLWCLFRSVAGSHADWAQAATAVCSAGLLGWVTTRPQNFALATLAAALVAYRGTIYDAVLLVLPMAMGFDYRVEATSGNQLFSKYVVIALFALPTLLFFLHGSYCSVALVALALLRPLRSTGSSN